MPALLASTVRTKSGRKSRQLYPKAAKRLGKPVDAVYYEGMGHMTSYTNGAAEPRPLAEARAAHMAKARLRAIAFLREHLMAP